MKKSFTNLKAPQVVATVTQSEDLAFLESMAQPLNGVDVLEFRLDNLANAGESMDRICEIQHQFQKQDYQILSTARVASEGGVGDLSESERQNLLASSLSSSDFIDIEIQTLKGSPSMQAFAREADAIVVGSFHDFEKCPPQAELKNQVEQAYEMGADIAKLAVVTQSFNELNGLVELVESQIDQRRAISAMGMGELGKLSRLVLARAGSCLNYGYLQAANAPGQWSAAQLGSLLVEI